MQLSDEAGLTEQIFLVLTEVLTEDNSFVRRHLKRLRDILKEEDQKWTKD